MRVFKLAYLCSLKVETPVPDVVFELPGMGMTRIHVVSLLNFLRSGGSYVSNPEELFANDTSLLRLRSLLDSRDVIYPQRGYSMWDGLSVRDRSQVYSGLRRSNSRFDPANVPTSELVQGTSSGVGGSTPRKSTVAFTPVSSQEKYEPRGSKRSRIGSDSTRSRSKSPREDPQFVEAVFEPHRAPKGSFRKVK